MTQPDALYRCPCRVWTDQIAYERHLAAEHGIYRDTLPAISRP